jgi:N-acetylmuramoyl-L-alanine amidase
MRYAGHLTWLAYNIYFEARGETTEGQIAVGHVTLNRVGKRYKSVQEIVLQPLQFSWANIGWRKHAIKDLAAFADCMMAAESCLLERLEGKNLFGADHYYSTSMKKPPKWAAAMRQVAHIGKHKFFRST